MADAINAAGSSVFRSLQTSKTNTVATNPQVATATQSPTPQAKPTEKKGNKFEKALPYVSAGISAAAVTAASIAVIKSHKSQQKLLHQMEELSREIKNPAEKPATADSLKKATAFVIGLVGAATGGAVASEFDKNKKNLNEIGVSDDEFNTYKNNAQKSVEDKDAKIANVEQKANEANNKANSIEGKSNAAINTANAAMSRANAVSNQDDVAMQIHRKPYYGLNLMVVDNNAKYCNKAKCAAAVKDINDAVSNITNRKPGETQQIIADYRKKYVPLLKSNSTWALTAEFDPIKAGGLGSVPMEIQNNFADMGIDNPVFIPMYQQKGNGEFMEYGEGENKKYKYVYGGETFDLKKMAEIPVQQYRGGKIKSQNVEFYLGHPKRQDVSGNKTVNEDQQIVFVKNTDNFGGDIYANNINSDEKEKFALFSKAVYQLAEAKVSSALGKNKTGLGEIKIADKEAFDAVKPPVSMILNDWHAAPMAGLLRYKAPMENAYNVIDDNVKDALKDMPLLMIGHNAGIPGSTRSTSRERSDFITENVINTLYDGYSFGITENAHTGRTPEAVCNSVLYERTNNDQKQFNNLAHGISLSDYYVPVSKNYEKELKTDAQGSGLAYNIIDARKDSDTISGEVNGLDRSLNTTEAKAGWLKSKFGMNLKTYNHLTPIDEVMEDRQHNKMEFYDNFLKPVMDGKSVGVPCESVGNPANISREDYEKAPLLAFAHRLTSQKGLEIFEKSVQDIFNTWDEKHPGQPKPIIIAGGQLEEASQAEFLEGLKNTKKYKNPDDVNRIQVLKGFMPNPAIYAAATYFNGPSTFEPCGLIQGEAFGMGTPVITTATGGYVDTVEDGVNGFVAPYQSHHQEVDRKNKSNDEWLKEQSTSLAGKMNEALDVYFNSPDKYKQMVSNNLNKNLSWNRGSNDDPIHGYINRLAISKEDTIEANVAPVRQFIVPILKQFDALQKGKIDEKTFEKNTKILTMISDNDERPSAKDKVFNSFDEKNSQKQSEIETNISTLDKHLSDYNSKIEINPNDSSSKGKIETLSLKKDMEKDKLDTIIKSEQTAEKDRQKLDKLIRIYVHNKTVKEKGTGKEIQMSKSLNNWKNDLIQKYSA